MVLSISTGHRIEPLTRDNMVALQLLAKGDPISGYVTMVETPDISADFEGTEAEPHIMDAMARRSRKKPSPFVPKKPDTSRVVGPLCHTYFHHPQLTKFYHGLNTARFHADIVIVPDETGWVATASSQVYTSINGRMLRVEYTEDAGESHRWMTDDLHSPEDVRLIADALYRYTMKRDYSPDAILRADAFTFYFGASFGYGVYTCEDMGGISVLVDGGHGKLPPEARLIEITPDRALGCLRIPDTRYASALYADEPRLRVCVQKHLHEHGLDLTLLERRWIVWPRHATPVDPP